MDIVKASSGLILLSPRVGSRLAGPVRYPARRTGVAFFGQTRLEIAKVWRVT